MFDISVFIPISFIVLSAVISVKLAKKGINKKVVYISQIISSGLVSLAVFTFAATNTVLAVGSDSAPLASTDNSVGFGTGLIAAALALGLPALGAGIAFSSAIPAAIAAMSENEKTFGKSMVFAIIAETIAIYGLLGSILILNKLDKLF